MSSLRILMYSHDTLGMGHTWRTITIASHLAKNIANASILVLTDLPIIGRLRLPANVDYVHLPGVVLSTAQEYQARNLNLDLKKLIKIRCKITQSALKTFKPQLIIVERDPLVLPDEMDRILSFVRDKMPLTKVVWGLSDIIGKSDFIVREWTGQQVYQMLDRFCDEIWVYGLMEIFDQIKEYQIFPPLSEKFFYVGYLRAASKYEKNRVKSNHQLPVVLVTTGSGSDGFGLLETYIRFLEKSGGAALFQSVIVSGPMMRTSEKHLLKERAEKLPNVVFHRFSKHFLQLVKEADLVVTTSGYNTLCEILSYRKNMLFVPTVAPPNERLLRAQIFERLGLGELLSPESLNPEYLGEKVTSAVSNPHDSIDRMNSVNIGMDGLDKIVDRIKSLAGVTDSAEHLTD